MRARDDTEQGAIHTRVDELTAVKVEIMKHRYDHQAQMCYALNEQQHIS